MPIRRDFAPWWRAEGEAEARYRTGDAWRPRRHASCSRSAAATGPGSSGCGGTPRNRDPAASPGGASCTRRAQNWRRAGSPAGRRAPARSSPARCAIPGRRRAPSWSHAGANSRAGSRSARSLCSRNAATGRTFGTETASLRSRPNRVTQNGAWRIANREGAPRFQCRARAGAGPPIHGHVRWSESEVEPWVAAMAPSV